MAIRKLKLTCKGYLWGGQRLKNEYNKEYPGDILAEIWELSCHPDGSSFIASDQQEYADRMALNADLNCGQSVLFLLEDPQAFQNFCGALLYLDGSEPSADAANWENMVLEWSQVFGTMPEGMEKPLYLGCRGCWKEEQREAWRTSREL